MYGQPHVKPQFTAELFDWLGFDIILGVKAETSDTFVATCFLKKLCYKTGLSGTAQTIDTYLCTLLCVHEKLRNKGLAKLIMKEMFRRVAVNMTGLLFSSPFTLASKETNIPLSLASISTGFRWMCRPLSLKKLGQTLLRNVSPTEIDIVHKTYKIKPTQQLNLFERYREEHTHQLLYRYYQDANLKQYRLLHIMNPREFERYFIPRDQILYTFVLVNGEGDPQDFVSFYVMSGQNNYKYAYLLHVTYHSLKALELILINTLYIAQRINVDFFFALDIGNLGNVLRQMKFKETGHRSYYHMINYEMDMSLKPSECGFFIPL